MNNNLPVVIKDDNLVNHEKLDKDEELIQYVDKYGSWENAALMLGYSESYSKRIKSYRLQSEKFVSKLIKYYNGRAVSLLPKIMGVESQVVNMLLKDPSLLPKFRHSLKEIKQTAGVLAQEHEAKAPMINIKELRNLSLQIHKGE